jgi:hypothetical protein
LGNVKNFLCFQGIAAVFLRLKITLISRNGRGHHGKNQVLDSEGIKKAVPEH